MKSRDLVESLLAVLAVYELFQGLHAFGYLIPFGETADGDFNFQLSILASGGVPLLLGLVLLSSRKQVARWLAPEDPSPSPPASEHLLEVLLAVVGVYIALLAVAQGAALLTGDYLRADFLRQLSAEPPRADEIWPPWIRVLVQLALGLGLALRREGVASLLRSFRTGRWGAPKANR